MRSRTVAAFAALALVTGAASPSSAAVTGSLVTLNGVTKAIGLTADLVTLFGLADNDAPSTSLTIDARGSAENFTLLLQGGVLDDTTDLRFSGITMGDVPLAGGGTANADFWKWELRFNSVSIVDSLVFNDSLTVSGSITHVIGPHPGDAKDGTPLTFMTLLDADHSGGIAIKSYTDPSVPKKKQHPRAHTDILTDATLSGTADSDFFGLDYFRNFSFLATAAHVPEPATWAMMIAGFGLVGARMRFSRRPASAVLR